MRTKIISPKTCCYKAENPTRILSKTGMTLLLSPPTMNHVTNTSPARSSMRHARYAVRFKTNRNTDRSELK